MAQSLHFGLTLPSDSLPPATETLQKFMTGNEDILGDLIELMKSSSGKKVEDPRDTESLCTFHVHDESERDSCKLDYTVL
jgi:hypothetical protein